MVALAGHNACYDIALDTCFYASFSAPCSSNASLAWPKRIIVPFICCCETPSSIMAAMNWLETSDNELKLVSGSLRPRISLRLDSDRLCAHHVDS